MRTETIPVALSRLPWNTQAAVLLRRVTHRIVDDCAPGRANDSVYEIRADYDFGDELFST